MKPNYKLVAKAKYIHTTADLASELWHEVYKRYYPAKQLDTLVDTLQSADAIEEDIDNDVNYFLVLLGGKVIGYFAWKMENTSLHLLTSTSSRSSGVKHWAGTSWPAVNAWPGARAVAGCGAPSTPRPCPCSSSSRPKATACWAPPRRTRPRGCPASSFLSGCCKNCKIAIAFLPRLHYNKVVY